MTRNVASGVKVIAGDLAAIAVGVAVVYVISLGWLYRRAFKEEK